MTNVSRKKTIPSTNIQSKFWPRKLHANMLVSISTSETKYTNENLLHNFND